MKTSTRPSYSNSKTLSDTTGNLPITTNTPVRGILFSSTPGDIVAEQAIIIVTNMDGTTSGIQTSKTGSIPGSYKKIIFIPLSIRNLIQAGDPGHGAAITNFNVFS